MEGRKEGKGREREGKEREGEGEGKGKEGGAWSENNKNHILRYTEQEALFIFW